MSKKCPAGFVWAIFACVILSCGQRSAFAQEWLTSLQNGRIQEAMELAQAAGAWVGKGTNHAVFDLGNGTVLKVENPGPEMVPGSVSTILALQQNSVIRDTLRQAPGGFQTLDVRCGSSLTGGRLPSLIQPKVMLDPIIQLKDLSPSLSKAEIARRVFRETGVEQYAHALQSSLLRAGAKRVGAMSVGKVIIVPAPPSYKHVPLMQIAHIYELPLPSGGTIRFVIDRNPDNYGIDPSGRKVSVDQFFFPASEQVKRVTTIGSRRALGTTRRVGLTAGAAMGGSTAVKVLVPGAAEVSSVGGGSYALGARVLASSAAQSIRGGAVYAASAAKGATMAAASSGLAATAAFFGSAVVSGLLVSGINEYRRAGGFNYRYNPFIVDPVTGYGRRGSSIHCHGSYRNHLSAPNTDLLEGPPLSSVFNH